MNQWRRLTETCPGEDEAVTLCLTPRKAGQARLCDAGRFWTPDGSRVAYWDSAAGLDSSIDGRSLPYLLQRYDILFHPLTAFPSV